MVRDDFSVCPRRLDLTLFKNIALDNKAACVYTLGMVGDFGILLDEQLD
jgi:hypothetical protein